MSFWTWLRGAFEGSPPAAPPAPGLRHLQARVALLASIRRDLAVSELLRDWWTGRRARLEVEEAQWKTWGEGATDPELRRRLRAVRDSIRAAHERSIREEASAEASVQRIDANVIRIESDLEADLEVSRAYGYDVGGLSTTADEAALLAYAEEQLERVAPVELLSEEREFLANLMRGSVGGRLDMH